jgi:hypothetical protein
MVSAKKSTNTKKKRNITRQGNILLTGQNLKQKGPWMNEGHPNHCSYKDSLLNSCNIAFGQRREEKKNLCQRNEAFPTMFSSGLWFSGPES